MTIVITLVIALLAFLLGAGVTYAILSAQHRTEVRQAGTEAQRIVADAKREAEQIASAAELAAKERYLAREQTLEKEWKAKRKELSKLESDLAGKEQALDKSLQQAKDRQNELTNRERKLTEKEA